jgi:hypothetical protein
LQSELKLREAFESVLKQLIIEARRFYGERLVSLLVFGSVGRDSCRPDSDIDLLLMVKGLPNGRLSRVREFAEVESRLEPLLNELRSKGIDTYLSPVFKTPDEVLAGSPLFLDMVEDARILYDCGNFMDSYLKNLGQRLQSLGARRVQNAGAWHWVLKENYQVGEVFEI